MHTPHRPSYAPSRRPPVRHPRRVRAAPALLSVLLLLLIAPPVPAQEVPDDAAAILERLVDGMRGGEGRARLTLTVERADRTDEYVLETVTDGAARALTRVVGPARDAGQAFLALENELFVYTPRMGRVLRLPPSGRSDAFLGSDLSYDDLAGDELRDDFDVTVAERTDEQVVLSLVPRPGAPTPYGELRFRASLPDLAPLELVFADQRGADVKRIRFEEIITLGDGSRFPARLVVEDLTDGGGRTVAAWTDTDFGSDVPERCFTQQALERGCP